MEWLRGHLNIAKRKDGQKRDAREPHRVQQLCTVSVRDIASYDEQKAEMILRTSANPIVPDQDDFVDLICMLVTGMYSDDRNSNQLGRFYYHMMLHLRCGHAVNCGSGMQTIHVRLASRQEFNARATKLDAKAAYELAPGIPPPKLLKWDDAIASLFVVLVQDRTKLGADEEPAAYVAFLSRAHVPKRFPPAEYNEAGEPVAGGDSALMAHINQLLLSGSTDEHSEVLTLTTPGTTSSGEAVVPKSFQGTRAEIINRYITNHQQDAYRKVLRATGTSIQRDEWYPDSTAKTWTDFGRAAIASCLLDHKTLYTGAASLLLAFPCDPRYRIIGWFYVYIEGVGWRWRRVVVDARNNAYVLG